VFCPEGSAQPTVVGAGNYSVGVDSAQRSSQVVCPRGAFCAGGVKVGDVSNQFFAFVVAPTAWVMIGCWDGIACDCADVVSCWAVWRRRGSSIAIVQWAVYSRVPVYGGQYLTKRNSL
jgi:hypothetical protein